VLGHRCSVGVRTPVIYVTAPCVPLIRGPRPPLLPRRSEDTISPQRLGALENNPGLMGLIAVSCNLLFGYGERRTSALALVLPLIISISFFLIADIDSPRAGVIRVAPQNLIALSQTMKPH
jgi:hypothetical protein